MGITIQNISRIGICFYCSETKEAKQQVITLQEPKDYDPFKAHRRMLP